MLLLDWLGLGAKGHAYIVAHGNVYEGGYNLHAERRARTRGLKGWMKLTQRAMNSYIEIEVEGTKYAIDKYLEDLSKGPPNSKIFNIEVNWRTYKGTFRDFRNRL